MSALAVLWTAATLVLMLSVLAAGTYFLYKLLIPGETARKYAFENSEDVGDGCFVELTAPNGFVEGEEAEITNSGTLDNTKLEKIPFLVVMRGNAGDEFINLLAAEEETKTIVLSKSMRISVALRKPDDENPMRSSPFKYEEVEVTRSRKPDLILGFIALLALSFTIPSGMTAIWELLFEI